TAPVAVTIDPGFPQATVERGRVLRRERPPQQARRQLPPRSGEHAAHLPDRGRKGSRRASRCAAHHHAHARSLHRRCAPRSRRQSRVPRYSVVAARSRTRAPAHERSGRLRAVRAGIRPRGGIDAVQHVSPLHRGRAPDPRGGQCGIYRPRRVAQRPPAFDRHHQAHQIARSALLRDPIARHRQGPAGRSFRSRRRHRRKPVQAPEMLRLLLILTVADIRAVGPGVWNGWKGQLLRELYYEAESVMQGGDATPARSSRVKEAKEALAKRIADFSPEARERALSRHYDSYWLAFDDTEHERHARLMAKADADSELLALSAESNTFRSITDIAIYTPDHPGLFSQLAGAVSVSGGSIVDAKAFTTTDGFALDVFSVQDADGGPFGDVSRINRLRENITRTVSGQMYPRKALAKREEGRRQIAAFRMTPRVNFDNDASSTATVIEVEGLDRPGLLYDVTRAIFDSSLSISSSIVATYGERAIDTFYVRDSFGHKIKHPDKL